VFSPRKKGFRLELRKAVPFKWSCRIAKRAARKLKRRGSVSLVSNKIASEAPKGGVGLPLGENARDLGRWCRHPPSNKSAGMQKRRPTIRRVRQEMRDKICSNCTIQAALNPLG